MIFYPCYDIIYLSFNLNVTDVTGLINEFARKMQNMNSWFWVGRGRGPGREGEEGAALHHWDCTNQLDVICCPCRSRNI